MCGIVVISSKTDKSDIIKSAIKAIQHRGKDYTGYHNEKIGDRYFHLAHCRLSINDLSTAGNQPFVTDDYALVVNGEVWNYHELRKNKDYNYQSNSDSEVILPYYADNSLQKLDGMFSFVLLERKTGKLAISRDWVGKIPLYYAIEGDNVYIASEQKAIRAISKTANIQFVPKNSMCNVVGTTFHIEENYYPAIQTIQHENLTHDKVAKDTYDLLDQAIRRRLIADVPIATLNSGGIDSSVITYLLSKYIKGIKCYTVKFDENSPDLKHARLLADKLGMELVEVDVPRDEEIIKQRFIDVCMAIEYPSNVQVQVGVMLSFVGEKLAKDGYKVVFSGEGSDENYGSYGMIRRFADKPDWCDIRRQLFEKQYYGNLLRGNNIFMSYGTIECRTPFFDRDFVNYTTSLPNEFVTSGKYWKYPLVNAFKQYLPQEIIDRPKAAFQKGTCFKDWFEGIILSDKVINNRKRKGIHYIIKDVIDERLGSMNDTGDLFE